MTGPSVIRDFLARQVRRRRGDLRLAALAAAMAIAANTLLLGLSGWFLAGAALAGAGSALAVQAFNYLLPSAALRGLAIARTISRYGERLFGHRAAFLAQAELRPALFAGLAAAPPQRSLNLSSGEASARLVQDVGAIETAFIRRSAPWAAGAAAVSAAAVIAPASRWAALAYLIGLGLEILIGRALGDRAGLTAGRVQLQAGGRLKDGLGAYLMATAELRCFDLTSRAIETLMAHAKEMGAAGLARRDASARLALVQTGVTAATLVAVATLSSGAALPQAALAVLACLAGLEGASGLLSAAEQQGAYHAAVARLDSVLTGPSSPSTPPPDGAVLEIDGHTFAPGTRVGVAGPSGSGKTRTLEALVGLRDAPLGRFRMGSKALEAAPIGWARGLFAYAPQDARLITGTAAENLRLAAPEAKDDDLWRALADAQLEHRFRRLPDGLETWLGDGGDLLSGGERRRLSLARAYLSPAPWLLLDEPTEGLDAATEAALLSALDQRLTRTGQGAVIVSHRPAPLVLCATVLDVSGRL